VVKCYTVKEQKRVDILLWLTVPTAAKRLGISNVSTYRAIGSGRLRVVETPLGVLVDPASVEEYARTRRPVRHKGEKVAAAC
jgi:excisionase family DNA binding protein